MIKLSKRLLVIANQIKQDDRVVDIGCDHGLLALYLLQNNIRVIASDINPNALKQIQTNTLKYQIVNMDIRLGDGLEAIQRNEFDTVVISGMGAETVRHILENAKEKMASVKKLIIQPNRDEEMVRRKVCQMGFYIDNEVVVYEGHHYYVVLVFSKGEKVYIDRDYFLGPVLSNYPTEEYLNMLSFRKGQYENRMHSISIEKERYDLSEKIQWITEMIKNDK